MLAQTCIHLFTQVYISVYIFLKHRNVCVLGVCVCVCVCVRVIAIKPHTGFSNSVLQPLHDIQLPA